MASPWSPDSTWGTVLADLVIHRVARYKTTLAHFVPNLEDTVDQVLSLLMSLNVPHVGVVHGDVCTPNVLVDVDTVTPLALLDFGFLTTSADPLFDATIATLIYDMYSSRTAATRESLYGMHVQAWGQRFEQVYPLYKAAYALATSNAYSAEGQDGHFRWCVDILNDQETNALVRRA